MDNRVLENTTQVREFSPKKNSGVMPLIGVFFFGALALMVLSLPFWGGEEVEGARSVLFFAMFGVFSGLTALSHAGWKASRTSFICDKNGITARRGEKEQFIAWSDIDDIQCVHRLGGAAELSVVFFDRDHKKVLSAYTEYLRRGGRDLLDYLFEQVRPIFERKARAYLNGEEHCRFALIQDVIRIDGRQLYVEFPKGKRQVIPFENLRRVEWLPGAISGSEKGHILIDYSGGRVKLPQAIPGAQYLIFALKYLVGGLNAVVNPQRDLERAGKIDALQRQRATLAMWRVTMIMVMIGAIVLVIRIGWEEMKRSQTPIIGIATMATVIEKKADDFVLLKYADSDGKRRERKTRLTPEFHRDIKPNAVFPVRVHPAAWDEIAFEGAWRPSPALLWTPIIAGALLFPLAAIILIVVLIKMARRGREIAALEAAEMCSAPTPAPFAAAIAPVVTPMAAPVPSGEVNTADTVVLSDEDLVLKKAKKPVTAPFPAIPEQAADHCRSCGCAIIGQYYLESGEKWCPDCRQKGDAGRKIGCRLLTKGFFSGFIGALIGGGLWATMIIVTGYELGLVAIVVGLITGYAVKIGTGAAGGRAFQVMALIFTFLGLSYSTIPLVIHEIATNPKTKNMLKDAWQKGEAQANKNKVGRTLNEAELAKLKTILAQHREPMPDTDTAPISKPVIVTASKAETVDTDLADSDFAFVQLSPGGESEKPPTFWKALGLTALLLALATLIVLVGPIAVYLFSLFSSPISILFLAIALWEAWRINQRQPLNFQGPFDDRQPIDFEKAEYERHE